MSVHGTGLRSFLLLTVLSFSVLNLNQAASMKEIKELSDRIMVNYSKYILPTMAEDYFGIELDVRLEAMGNIDEIDETLSTVLWVQYFWKDESIKWDKEKENTKYITLGWADVWKPVLQLTNPQTDFAGKPSVDRSIDTVVYDYHGHAYYDELMTVRTSCDLDMSYYPFDVQECDIKMRIVGSTKYNFKLSVLPYSDISEEDAEHGSWTLEQFNASSDAGEFVLNLRFKRHPLFLLLNIICPLFILALLSPIVFILPKKSGERVGYAVAMLLSISVYMTIVSEHLPHNSKPVPLLSVMVFIWYTFDAAVVLVVIINTQINLNRTNKRIPKAARWFVMLNRKCNRNFKGTNETSSEEIQKCIELEDVDVSEEEVKNEQDDKAGKLSGPYVDEDVTWQELSRFIDKWFFVASYILKIALPVIFLTLMAAQTHNQ